MVTTSGPIPLRTSFGRICRDIRLRLDLTLQDVADAADITASYLARVEHGTANPTLGAVERIASALGLRLDLDVQAPVFLSTPRLGDPVHARCSIYADRRLRAAGWATAREVGIHDGRYRGWIDLLAFDPTTGTLLIVEIKTRLDDIGAMERQVDRYERHAREAARGLDWSPRAIRTIVLLLASGENDDAVRRHRELLATAFPRREGLLDPRRPDLRRGLAMIDPRRRRAAWLIKPAVDGRRSPAPYPGYADAASDLVGTAG